MNFKVNNNDIKMLSLDESHPINSILITMNSIDPSTYLGGTWEEIAQGRTIVGVNQDDSDFDTPGKLGGNKTYDLRALIGCYDSQIHKIGYYASTQTSPNNNFSYGGSFSSWESSIAESRINHSTPVRSDGGANYTTIQPYITTYIWKRTA